MAQLITQNIHGVVSIRVQPVIFESFVSHTVTFELSDGSTVEVNGFAEKVLQIVTLDERPRHETEAA